MALVKASNRLNVVTQTNNGDIFEFGPGGGVSQVGAIVFQFAPSLDFAGTFLVIGKMMGVAAETAPFLPISYRRVNINTLASDYAIVADAVVPSAIIQVPSNGLSIALLVSCTAGKCQVYSWDLQGSSAI